ncbi:MAG: histidinol-phosphatase HisJ family protein [Clostridiales bacterium]|nr:histidinol-phosphatase HisJ family protein [Clostridiales bacterium]
MLNSDTHLHSFFSSDSEATPEAMIQKAIDLGLKTICFTEHYDPDYPENEEGLDFLLDFDAYYSTFLQLKEKYASQIEVLHGIELGVQRHLDSVLMDFYIRRGGRYDFIINSCHLVEGIDPYDGVYFKQHSPEEGTKNYFENILGNLKAFPFFQSAGHLDYITRYISTPRHAFRYADYQDILDAILRCLIENGKGLEVNTAGLKYGLPWPNPHMDILRRYRELGGEIVTIGSDAHKPEDMAYAFDRLPAILEEAGFRYYALYRKQRPEFIPIR